MTDTMKKIWGVLALIIIIGSFVWLTTRFDNKSSNSDSPEANASISPEENALVPIHFWQTSKGLKVYFVERPDIPMVELRLIIDSGSKRDGTAYGLSYLTAQMIKNGTINLSDNDIATKFDELGAQYNSGSNRDVSIFSLTSLSDLKYLNPAFDLFTQMITQPSFPENALAREQMQIIQSLEYQEKQPASVASLKFYALNYQDYPYNHGVLGTIDTVKTLSQEQLKQFHATYYNTRNAELVIVGDVSLDDAENLAETLENEWIEGDKAAWIPPATPITEAITAFEFLPTQQSRVIIGQVGINADNPHYAALNLGNYILGGSSLKSRLGEKIRVEQGLVYSINSNFNELKGRGPFSISFSTSSNQVNHAYQATLETLQDFLQTKVSDEELSLAKNTLTTRLNLGISSNAGVAQLVTNIATQGWPLDWLSNYIESLNNVTPESIQQAFNETLSPKHLVTVVVGSEDLDTTHANLVEKLFESKTAELDNNINPDSENSE